MNVSQKISQLVKEGYPRKQAIAIAFSEQRAGKVRRNPVPKSAQVEKAKRLYEEFSGHAPEEVAIVDKPVTPDVLIAVGTCDGIMYTTVRDGKTEKYIHKFKAKSRPLLCVSFDGKQSYLLGGEYDFTERGFVDRT